MPSSSIPRSAEELPTDPEVMEFPARYGEDVFEDSIEPQNLLEYSGKPNGRYHCERHSGTPDDG